MTFLVILSVILVSTLMILLSNVNVIRHLICGNNLNWLLHLILIYETLWTRAGSGLLISMLEKVNWFHLTSLITLALLKMEMENVKMDGLFFGLNFSSKLDWSSYIISVGKTASEKIGAFIRS